MSELLLIAALNIVFAHLIVEMRSLYSDGLSRAADIPLVLDELVLDEQLLSVVTELCKLIESITQSYKRIGR